MGKLYDRKDLEWDLALLDRMGLDLSRFIADGTLSPFEAQELEQNIDKERQRCRMRLLRTGQLISDLTRASRIVRACPICIEVKGKVKACPAHKKIWRSAVLNVKYAAEENLGRRAISGQPPRLDDLTEHTGSLNQWETLYFQDLREKAWPGQSPEELAYNKEHFDSLDYRGWLNMLRWSAEEISDADYQSELRRLDSAKQLAEQGPEIPASRRKRDRLVRSIG